MGILSDICASEKHLFYQMKRTAVSRRSKNYLLWLLLVIVPAISSFAQAPAGRSEFQFVFGGRVTEFDEKKAKDIPLDACTVNLYKGATLVSTNIAQNSHLTGISEE